MRKKPILIRIILLILPILLVLLTYEQREFLIHLGTLFPSCPSYRYLGIYCPGCGNTRSVQHLLTGDIPGSLYYNPVPVVGIILFVLFYFERIMAVFGRQIKIIPRGKKFWAGFTGAFIVFFVLRNLIE